MNCVEIIREATKASLDMDDSFNEDIFQLALAKAKRWMRNAYGGVDLKEYINETGGSVHVYYNECMNAPNGGNTFNRQIARNRRINARGTK